jgi:hypothetical protein
MVRVPLVGSLVIRLLALAPRHPGRGGRRPREAWPQLVGHDIDHGAGAAVLSGPGAQLEPAHDDSAASADDEPTLSRTA